MGTRRDVENSQLDLFSLDVAGQVRQRLDGLRWPDAARFPVNRASDRVRAHVWTDLVESRTPLIVAGYSSIGELVAFVADWEAKAHAGTVRVVLGSEPFSTSRTSFISPSAGFTAEVRGYWYERGISVRQSAQVLAALRVLDEGRLSVRFVHGSSPLHAKVYVGDHAATTGSSNFTTNGLGRQTEVNARFRRAEDRQRFDELVLIGENLWEVGADWTESFRDLLHGLLQVVTWREALARACAELLEGDWAGSFLEGLGQGQGALWPSQRTGIAQAMWIIENVGSVLVADATGSGKTKMGAHLVRAVRDRLWATGRARRDLTVLVCPPAVEDTWRQEAILCGLSLDTVSHGRLSQPRDRGPGSEHDAVRRAQLLAVDEAHNFLNPTSLRTQFLRENLADHVLLFTATPISRGAADLLDMVALLGPDNFDEGTHEILRKLERGRRLSASLNAEEVERLRIEIQRFTLRRTKSQLNALVEADASAYRHPVTGRTCRYPEHVPHAYDTKESLGDVEIAKQIRGLAAQLRGMTLLPSSLAPPASMRAWFSDDQWVTFRLRSAAGLAAHHVMSALRSSRAALHEHLRGTPSAAKEFGLPSFKSGDTGDVIAKTAALDGAAPPSNVPQGCGEGWLVDERAWRAACRQELETYERIEQLLSSVGPAREQRKAEVLADLAVGHPRVLAFDSHLITLSLLRRMLRDQGATVLLATGQSGAQRRRLQREFAPDTTGDEHVIALCSDAMNEGLNLQGASAVVHLDLPTTLRVAEQRVGRVDRMDTPHDAIEAWWPRDGDAFATRTRERLVARVEESQTLLGANLPMPDLGGDRLVDDLADEGDIVDVEAVHREVEAALERHDDDIFDALDPVRGLVHGADALITPREYQEHRYVTHRVMARVAPLRSTTPWAFFAARASIHGAPRWMFVRPGGRREAVTDLRDVAQHLREFLRDDPPGKPLDEHAMVWLDRCLDVAARAELDLMPRKLQRALSQMRDVAARWAEQAQREADEQSGARWSALARMAQPSLGDYGPDLAAVAERWLEVIAPRLEEHRQEKRRRRYVLINDITPGLIEQPLDLDDLERRMSGVPLALPFGERVSACILGVPGAVAS